MGSFPQVISQGMRAGSALLGPHLQSPGQQLLPRTRPRMPWALGGRPCSSPPTWPLARLALPVNSRLLQGWCCPCHQLKVCSLLVPQISVCPLSFSLPYKCFLRRLADSILRALRPGVTFETREGTLCCRQGSAMQPHALRGAEEDAEALRARGAPESLFPTQLEKPRNPPACVLSEQH